ncbi:hypothetical protein FE257_010817 [Aspergillus nanangensis]|uniref:DUF7872 domain-containing protein n=1 Tax=Aspergillus nanangensis TaxID=2582783 RepID=A0AAD4CVJ3_ASPNN|nr:hypothetical protein FE257_010817 [Aspergillus nanangensis]
MRYALVAAALTLGAQGELLHDKFHRMGTNLGHSNGTAPSSTTPAVPGPSNSTVPIPHRNSTGCVDLTNLKPEDWEAFETSNWLDNWWNANQQAIAQNGFISTFGELILGDSTWTCALGGTCNVTCVPMQAVSASQDSLQARQAVTSNDPANAAQAGGNVAASVQNLHEQFDTLRLVLATAGTLTNADLNSVVENFWRNPDNSGIDMSEGLRSFATVVGLAACFATGGVAIPAAAGSAIVSGAITLGLGAMPSTDARFTKAADVGSLLTDFMANSALTMDSMYRQIAHGGKLQGTDVDVRTMLTNGTYLDEHAGEMATMIADSMRSVIINHLWREQRVFIIGGASCAESQGIGSTGSHEGYEILYWCDPEGKAWYLYSMEIQHENADPQVTYVGRPWGADRMGENPYFLSHGGTGRVWESLNPWNAIISSVKSYKVAGSNYTSDTWSGRLDDMFRAGTNPWMEGNAMEGLWTIPTCDVSWAVNSDIAHKDAILYPYGWDMTPKWCGWICENDEQKTRDFYKSANLLLNSENDNDFPFMKGCETSWV